MLLININKAYMGRPLLRLPLLTLASLKCHVKLKKNNLFLFFQYKKIKIQTK